MNLKMKLQEQPVQKRLVLESSEPPELHSTSPELTLQLRVTHTVLGASTPNYLLASYIMHSNTLTYNDP